MTATGRKDLALTLSELARTLQAETSPHDTIRGISRAAITTIPGTDHAGITLVHEAGKLETVGATDPLVEQIDAAQYRSGQGPCLESASEHGTFRIDDMRTDQRWPRFTPEASALGVRSMLSFQLFVQDGTLGALNLYAVQPDAFDLDSEHVGLLLAAHAAVALSGAQRVDSLRVGMHSRDMIGQAKGLLMCEYKITGDQAFGVLIRYSQDSSTPLRDLAGQLVAKAEERASIGRPASGTR